MGNIYSVSALLHKNFTEAGIFDLPISQRMKGLFRSGLMPASINRIKKQQSEKPTTLPGLDLGLTADALARRRH